MSAVWSSAADGCWVVVVVAMAWRDGVSRATVCCSLLVMLAVAERVLWLLFPGQLFSLALLHVFGLVGTSIVFAMLFLLGTGALLLLVRPGRSRPLPPQPYTAAALGAAWLAVSEVTIVTTAMCLRLFVEGARERGPPEAALADARLQLAVLTWLSVGAAGCGVVAYAAQAGAPPWLVAPPTARRMAH